MWAVQEWGMFDRWETLYDGFLDADHAWAQLQREHKTRHDIVVKAYEEELERTAELGAERKRAEELLAQAKINWKIRLAPVLKIPAPKPIKEIPDTLRIVKYDE